MKARRAKGVVEQSELKRGMRRIALAVPISMLIHLAVGLLMRPTYRPVSDYAMDLEVIEAKPGPPPPPSPPLAEPEKTKTNPEELPEKPTATVPSPALPREPALQPASKANKFPQIVQKGEADAGAAGTGICLHNLFPFAPPNPSWLLFVSLSAFRDTAYQSELGRTFSSFSIGRRLVESAGIDPMTEVESLLVTAEDIFDWRTFRVVASYDSGEDKIVTGLKKSRGSIAYKWTETAQGYEVAIPGSFRWHLVSSGRVLAVTYEPEAANTVTKDNPKARSKNATDGTDAGVADHDAGASGGRKSLPPGTFPDWPRQVTCLVQKGTQPDEGKGTKKTTEGRSDLTQKSESFLTPDAEGHWPVALLLTQDPRAVGLDLRTGIKLGFEYALVRGYFTDPVRIEGVLQFKGDPNRVASLATSWQAEAKQAANDPFLSLAGVSPLLRNLHITSEGNRIIVSLQLKENQVISTLLFLQLQGKVLEGYLK